MANKTIAEAQKTLEKAKKKLPKDSKKKLKSDIAALQKIISGEKPDKMTENGLDEIRSLTQNLSADISDAQAYMDT